MVQGVRGEGMNRHYDWHAIQARHEAGETFRAIAESLGTSRNALSSGLANHRRRRRQGVREYFPRAGRGYDIVRVIYLHMSLYGYSPSLREIAHGLGLRSVSKISNLLVQLEQQGYIKRHAGKRRSIVVTSSGEDLIKTKV